ncbi:hypothetical protein R0131_13390 [Clostridium sp. AL.422]|uniref:hypothetical protein n=1 Tax=Clostridium TaxID=1485 RepID=UPI00293DD771|nr:MULTISPECIES: hypothetical protein [unclassified Clostridium]MDV4151816.1 hypothetical protein [Clostridium sp. AL.422]
MELKILELSASHAFGLEVVEKNNEYISVIDEYELESTDLSNYNVLLIDYFADQEYLYKHKDIIENFLNDGKVIVFCGHLFRKWLPGCSLFMPKKLNNYKDYLVETVPGSPLFDGVEIEDMVFNKGVAGFFARGYYYPPEKAEVYLTFTDGKVISYIDRNTTNGTIIVHAGRSILGYTNSQNTTKKISEQALTLLKEEVCGGKK